MRSMAATEYGEFQLSHHSFRRDFYLNSSRFGSPVAASGAPPQWGEQLEIIKQKTAKRVGRVRCWMLALFSRTVFSSKQTHTKKNC